MVNHLFDPYQPCDKITAYAQGSLSDIHSAALISGLNRHDLTSRYSMGALGLPQSAVQQAIERSHVDAALAATMFVKPGFEIFRPPIDVLSNRLIDLELQSWWRRDLHLAAFNQAATLSNSIAGIGRVEHFAIDEWRKFANAGMPQQFDLAQSRQFLDSAGLYLPRWPVIRSLEIRDRKRRVRLMLNESRPSRATRRAMTLLYQHERVIRQIIDDVMESEYGSDWPQERLPLCNCRDLLGKWSKAGWGQVLDHADFTHYERIVGFEEHFDRIFSEGFDSRETLVTLIADARKARRAPFHATKQFTAADLISLRVTFKSLETGLAWLLPDDDLD